MNRQEALKILELSSTASEEEIKKAFKQKAAKIHPDVNKADDAESKFKQINEAYQVLQNKQPDQYNNPFAYKSTGPKYTYTYSTYNVPNYNNIKFDFEDIFESAFGYGFNDRYDLTISISIEEAVKGCKKEHVYSAFEKCKNCDYLGYTIDHRQIRCPQCNGDAGKTVEKKVEIEIPAGVLNGQVIPKSVDGGGMIYITIKVQNSDNLKLAGNNIHSTIKISLLEALTGITKEVDTAYGKKMLRIPGPRKHADQVVASGLGLNSRFDHVFTLSVEYPENIGSLVEFLKKEK